MEGSKQNGFHCLVNWGSVCRSKKQGGMGIKNLEQMNLALLEKWIQKMFGMRVKKSSRKLSPIWKGSVQLVGSLLELCFIQSW